MFDFHLHTTLSCDGRCTMDQMARKAVELGLEAICFTEHMDFDPADPGYGFLDYEKYCATVAEVQDRYAGKIAIFKGIELDYQKRFENQIRDWLADKEFDLAVGSVHYVAGGMLSEEFLAEKDVGDIYLDYLERVRLSAESRLFGVIGHLDYVKKFTGDASYLHLRMRLRPALENALRAIIAGEAALEVSTKGLVAKSRDYRPSLEIVRHYRRLGGRIVSIGSDAHDCEVLGTGVARLQRICEKMGLRVLADPGKINVRLSKKEEGG